MKHPEKNRFPVFLLAATLLVATANAQSTSSTGSQEAAQTPATPNSVVLPEVDVVAKALDVSREDILPSLGATQYTVTSEQISSQSEGDNASINQTILRFPGVAQDSYSQLHVRGEHANLQYRIDGVMLPEGISLFGQELSTRFVDSMSLITGALPAEYGLRTAGVIDIQTKTGASLSGGDVSMYGGSFDTINPSFEYGGASGRFIWYMTGNFLHNDIGIENPTPSANPIHDNTNQTKSFAMLSYIIDDTSRLNLILSAAYSTFQIPNNPGQPQLFTLEGTPTFDSSNLNENQNEQNYYGILSYQKKLGDIDFQVSAFTRYSGLLFDPDDAGDLIFNGVASRVDRGIFGNGFQGDASWKVNDSHTIRGGATFTEEYATVDTNSLVFPADSMGNQTSSVPFNINDNSGQQEYLYGFYLQDEWKIVDKLTLNFGGRFDGVDAYVNENQLSPRANLVYQPTDKTTLHLGYARYFTPPPLELVAQETVAKFAGTTNAPAVAEGSPVKSERSNYFDAGIKQNVFTGLHLGLDGYFKEAENQLDEGQFGPTVIFSPFNYAKGQVYGSELTADYDNHGFSAYGNVAYTQALGETISSGQFQFSPAEQAYISDNWVHLDHEQHWTASAGASYTWAEGTKLYADLLYGSGLRNGFANTTSLPGYTTVNIGLVQTIKIPHYGAFKARFDIVNLFDKIYEIRDGSGIGVFAPQYGARRGFYGGLEFDF